MTDILHTKVAALYVVLSVGLCIWVFKRIIYSYSCISSNLLMQGRLYYALESTDY
jgi:hypothetical protein